MAESQLVDESKNTETQEETQADLPVAPETGIDWKAQARKWERRAKVNGDAAEKLEEATKRVSDLEKNLKDANAHATEVAQALDAADGDPLLARLLLAKNSASMADFATMLRDFASAPKRPIVQAIGKRGTPATQETTAAFVRRLFS